MKFIKPVCVNNFDRKIILNCEKNIIKLVKYKFSKKQIITKINLK